MSSGSHGISQSTPRNLNINTVFPDPCASFFSTFSFLSLSLFLIHYHFLTMSTASPLARSALNTTEQDDGYGYNANVFPEKESQMVKVISLIEQTGFMPKELVQNEVSWFYK